MAMLRPTDATIYESLDKQYEYCPQLYNNESHPFILQPASGRAILGKYALRPGECSKTMDREFQQSMNDFQDIYQRLVEHRNM